ncbi:glycosyl transferase family 25 [Cricetibacter osteomyelitidis]|uniref:Glycosyl transferase family 25 n=1 Tax=Cricetibacter osteomyelitidis TaxID=1521931 RepID=A0A4R2SJT2_9PAST|nr:glycosyltransferase family 25 protein [Cricetibacter osteomyelitidis]TCP90099.1 glycosyl transferase family 25 [Cricetibacter osteomyelitidis]
MKKYLISLDKDIKRREIFFAQPDTVDFEIFRAVNMMDKTEQDFPQLFDVQGFQQRYGRAVTRGEIGCTLSHLTVYRQIQQDPTIQNDEFVLVCEDDALFAEHFAQHLNTIIQQNIQADIILVGQSKIATFNNVELEINYPTTFKPWQKKLGQSDYTYSLPYKNYFAGTVAYLIKKSTVDKFLNPLKNNPLPYWLADDYILFGNEFTVKTLVIRPLLCIENPILESNLSGARKDLANNLLKKVIKYPLKKLLAIKRNLGNQ